CVRSYSSCCLSALILCSFPTRRSSDLIKLFLLVLAHHHLPGFRQNGQIVIAPLGVVRVISVGVGQTSQMAHTPADPPAAALQIRSESTRLNSSHVSISYAVFCSKKKTH